MSKRISLNDRISSLVANNNKKWNQRSWKDMRNNQVVITQQQDFGMMVLFSHNRPEKC